MRAAKVAQIKNHLNESNFIAVVAKKKKTQQQTAGPAAPHLYVAKMVAAIARAMISNEPRFWSMKSFINVGLELYRFYIAWEMLCRVRFSFCSPACEISGIE